MANTAANHENGKQNKQQSRHTESSEDKMGKPAREAGMKTARMDFDSRPHRQSPYCRQLLIITKEKS
jgi:hypothetical protein